MAAMLAALSFTLLPPRGVVLQRPHRSDNINIGLTMLATVDDAASGEQVLLDDLLSFFADDDAPSSPAPAADPDPDPPPIHVWNRDEQALLQRRKQFNKGRSHRARTTPLLRSGQPRAASPPAFTTSVHDQGNGFWEIDLHASDQSEGAAAAGRIFFIEQTPSEAGVEVADALNGASTAELKHVEVVDSMRGFDGGTHLLIAMANVLRRVGCEYVLLEHLDRGSGKLVRYYEQLGFKPAPARVQDEHITREHMLVRLDELVAKL